MRTDHPTMPSAPAAVTPLVPGGDHPRSHIAIGDKFSRYRIESLLGAGGMGTVYAAFDPNLDRRVAIKVLHPKLSRTSGHRLRREAKALARLNHPNVVTLYELDTVEGRMFLAMELVEGCSLRDWCDQPRRWEEIVDVMVGAGQGLVAAHGAGLVHRDFKPDNVLVGVDGRARVTDFGLVRASDDVQTSVSSESPISDDGLETDHGMVLGTPAYMSVEQWRGDCNQLSDQYSFCVTFYEALFGHRPFVGHDSRKLQAAILSGSPIPPPPNSGVPGWLIDVILRGLHREAGMRFASMAELLEEIEARPRRRRRLWQMGLATVMGGGLAAAAYTTGATAGPTCEDANALAGVWDNAVQTSLAEHFGATARADRGWTLLANRIDQHAATWVAVSQETCETKADTPTARATRDLVISCLADRRRELSALTQALSEADPVVLERPGVLIGALRSPQRCTDADALARAETRPSDEASAEIIESGSSAVAQARTLAAAGRFTEAVERAEQAYVEAKDLGWPPLVARTAWTRANMVEQSGDITKAGEAWGLAVAEAERASDDRYAASAWIGVANAEAIGQGRAAVIDQALRMADAKIERVQGEADLRASLESARAAVLSTRGEIHEAVAAQRRALEYLDESSDPDPLDRAFYLSRLGSMTMQAGDLDGALDYNQQAVADAKAVLGEGHPLLATFLGNLATSYYVRGELEAARDAAKTTVELFEASLQPDSIMLAKGIANLSMIERNLDNHEEGIALAERALKIREEALGPDHLEVAQSLDQIGSAYVHRGDFERALEAHQRSLDIRLAQLPEDHPWLAYPHVGLGKAYLERGDAEEAAKHFDRARALREAAGSDAGERGEAIYLLATAKLAAGDRVAAAELGKRAQALLQSEQLPGSDTIGAWLDDNGLR